MIVSLFPLPNVILFPKLFLPLHIFEPRYRAMVKDALEGERLICMVLLKRGWEEDYYRNPPIFKMGCLGRIVESYPLEDGRYNILLYGLARVELDELPMRRSYREAEARVIKSVSPEGLEGREADMRSQLLLTADSYLKLVGIKNVDISKLRDVPIGEMVDVLAFLLPIDPFEKQSVLEEVDVVKRWQQLLGIIDWHLNTLAAGRAHPELH